MSPAIVTAIGWTAPAPSPWIARNAMSAGIDHATAHSSDPRANSPMPRRTTGLRPIVSASLE
jgi:hypothetical protein